MKKTLFLLLVFCLIPAFCFADVTEFHFNSCTVLFFDDWGFVEYTENFEKLSSQDRMFYNPQGDVFLFSVFSDVNNLPQNKNTDLFTSANTIIKNFQALDGSSIVTLGEIDDYPRITIVDESDSLSKSQWFIFTGEEIIYIGFQSSDKYRTREYNSALYNTKIH